MRLLDSEAAARLGRAWRESGYDRAAPRSCYGPDPGAAAERGDYRALLAACGDDAIGVWTRLFTIGIAVDERAAAEAFAPSASKRRCGAAC
ncbi:hypothetical protein GCM10029992_60360 [Glycomyces albus]